MKKYLFIFPLSMMMVCAGSKYKQINDIINSECGENCTKNETIINSDTVVSNKIDFKKRTGQYFNKIKKGMTVSELVKMVGSADCDCGCGIHVLVYALLDGSLVHVGANDQKVLFVKHIKIKQLK